MLEELVQNLQLVELNEEANLISGGGIIYDVLYYVGSAFRESTLKRQQLLDQGVNIPSYGFI